VDVLAGLEPLVLHSWSDSEGVGTEEVSLGLDKVGGQGLGSVTVEEGQSGGERWDRDTPEATQAGSVGFLSDVRNSYSRGLSDNSSPSWLSGGNGLKEEGRDEQVLEVWLVSVGGGDVRQEDGL
jgi:hypothetical protein